MSSLEAASGLIVTCDGSKKTNGTIHALNQHYGGGDDDDDDVLLCWLQAFIMWATLGGPGFDVRARKPVYLSSCYMIIYFLDWTV